MILKSSGKVLMNQ